MPSATAPSGEHTTARNRPTRAAGGRAGGVGDVIVGDVEQRSDGVEVTIGLRGNDAAPGCGVQPAPLQPRPTPRLPQSMPRVLVCQLRCRAEYRPDSAQSGRVHGRVSAALTGERVHKQIRKLPWLFGVVAATQAAAQPAQRHRVDPTDRPGDQCQRLLAVQTLGGGGQRDEQGAHRGVVGGPTAGRRRAHRDPRSGKRAGQHGRRVRKGPDDHGHLRPRHVVDEVCAAQFVGDQRRLGMRG